GVLVVGIGSEAATVTSGGGNVSVIGQAGVRLGFGVRPGYGPDIFGPSVITAGGSGTVTVIGTGTDGKGVFLSDFTSLITSTGGGVSVTGPAGGRATPVGILLHARAPVTRPGAHSVTLTGTGAGTGDISIAGTVSSTSGAINVTSSGLLSETDSGLISTTGTLTTNSATGTTLNGAGTNAVGTFHATNTT